MLLTQSCLTPPAHRRPSELLRRVGRGQGLGIWPWVRGDLRVRALPAFRLRIFNGKHLALGNRQVRKGALENCIRLFAASHSPTDGLGRNVGASNPWQLHSTSLAADDKCPQRVVHRLEHRSTIRTFGGVATSGRSQLRLGVGSGLWLAA